MPFADALPNETANTSDISTSHSHSLPAYSQDERFPAVVPIDDICVSLNMPSANAGTIATDKSFMYLGAESRESKGNDTQLTGIVKSREVLYLRWRTSLEMKRYGPFCNLANRMIGQSEDLAILFVQNNPKVSEGVRRSKRKPDIIVVWGGHVRRVNGLWKNYSEKVPPENDREGRRNEGGGEDEDRKGKDGNEAKDSKRCAPRDGRDTQYVVEFKMDFSDSASLSAPSLNFKRPIGSVNCKREDCLPRVNLADHVDDLLRTNSFGWETMFFDEMFKADNRICSAIIMERLVPLRYVKSVDHLKRAIREVVQAHHLAFSNELRFLHLGISIDNLLVRYYDTSTFCGVLIDFDLTVVFGEITEDHTGTRIRSRPFMAWELLESDPPPIHMERLDWESFFYVICWIGCRYSEGKEVNNSILSNWYSSDDATLTMIKGRWLFGPDLPQRFTPFYDTLVQDWIDPLQTIFYDGQKAQGNAVLNKEFDEVTLGGHVTWDRFWGILRN